MDIAGVAALVTGGGSGLGEATARALASAGAKVAILDINAENGAKVAAAIGGVAFATDVVDEASVIAALDGAEQRHGPARILVNCAGVGNALKTVGKAGVFPLDQFTRVIQINLIGSFNVLRLAAARMIGLDPHGPEERGVIINTASVAAYDGQVGQAAYSASKGGIVGMTLPIARDLAQHGVRVMTIAPGLFLTPLLLGLPQEAQHSLGRQVPFPSRLGDPAEYAALAVHIVQNAMLNGEVIRLDGAIRMAPR